MLTLEYLRKFPLKSVVVTIILGFAINHYWIASVSDIGPISFDMAYRPASVFVLGATGEVGKEVVKELAKHAQIGKVTLIGRRKIDLPTDDINYNKFTQTVVDFDKIDEYTEAFKGHDVGICALGTTRSASGVDGFYKVDHDYIVNSAKLAKECGCKHFNLVSSAGANKNAWILYPKTKGQVEEELTNMAFDRMSIYRPGFLLCNRTNHRTGESIINSIMSCADRWRVFSVETAAVASAIVKNIFKTDPKKVEILYNSNIRDFGKDEPVKH